MDDCQALGKNNGTLALTGSIALPQTGDKGDINVALTLKQVSILERTDIQSELSGELNVNGDFERLLAIGELDIAPLNAVISGHYGSSIPSIETINIEELKNPADINQAKQNSLLPLIELDISIVADQEAFVRGRGLEAELYGEMKIKGTSNEPKFTGDFNVRRGQFEIFNKRFDLEKGEVSFANDAISLDIEGTYEKSDESITAKLIGPSDDIEIQLSSVPSRPDDEILSLLIFGKSVQSISAFEAVRLAMAVQTLRGGSSAFDPIGSTRDLLGVDTLSIDNEDDDGNSGVNLGIGKYLSERVYLELQRTPDPAQPWKGNIDIELTPSLHLESSAGGSSGIEGAELSWKRDY